MSIDKFLATEAGAKALKAKLKAMPEHEKAKPSYAALWKKACEAVKLKGSIFIREDLVSWVVESDDDYAKNLGYVRDVYKDKAMTKKFSKDDAVAVFEEEKQR